MPSKACRQKNTRRNLLDQSELHCHISLYPIELAPSAILTDFRFRKHHRQQLRVGGTEIKCGHLDGSVPAEGFVLERGGLRVGCGLAVDKCQVDRAVGVGVGNRRADSGVHDLKRDLLAAFPGKCLAGRFTGFDLPADKLPVPALRLAERPTAEEKLVPSAYDTAYDLNHFPYRFHSTLLPDAQSIA